MRQQIHHVGILLDNEKVSNFKTFRLKTRLWTIVTLLLLVALTIFFNVSDFVVIQRSSERTRKGSEKHKERSEDPIEYFKNLNEPILFISDKGEQNDNITDLAEKPHENNNATSRTSTSSWNASDYSQQPGSLISLLPLPIKNSSVFVTNRSHVLPQPVAQSNSTRPLIFVENTSSAFLPTAPIVPTEANLNETLLVAPQPSLTAKFVPTTTTKPTSKVTDSVSAVTTSTTSSCRRKCHNYNNKLLLSRPDRAGMNDRMFVLGRSLQLAGYLCARLYMARPKFWLAAGHNNGQLVDVRMTWPEFATSRFLDDGSNSSAMVDWVNHDDINSTPLVYKITRSRKYNKWLYVRTENATDIVSHLEQIEAFSFSQGQQRESTQQQGFIWEIQPDFHRGIYLLIDHMRQRHRTSITPSDLINRKTTNSSGFNSTWRTDMQPHGLHAQERGCPYAAVETPKDIEEMAKHIFDQISQNAASSTSLTKQQPLEDSHNNSKLEYNNETLSPRPWIGYFHVRRGDAIAACNTTLERMEQYLNCSLGEPLSALAKARTGHLAQRRRVILLFSSDERNTKYRSELARLVEQQESYDMVNTAFTVSCADLDELGRNVISTFVQQGRMPAWRLNNNFYLFRLISYIEWGRSEITFRLEQRRSTCPTCSNIAWQLGKDATDN